MRTLTLLAIAVVLIVPSVGWSDDTLVRFKGGIGVDGVSGAGGTIGTAEIVTRNIVRGVQPVGTSSVIADLTADVTRDGRAESAVLMLRDLLLTFVTLFVAVDVVAVVVIYVSVGVELEEPARRRMVLEATMTAAVVGFAFLLVGDTVLQFLGVTVGDFQIAGGVLLLVLSIYDLLHPEQPLRQPGAGLGVVPLGIPMIVGPAVLTALLTLARTRGYTVTLIGFGLNLVVVWAALRWASVIRHVLGDAGCRAVSKVLSLILAAIGVTFIRRGVMATLPS